MMSKFSWICKTFLFCWNIQELCCMSIQHISAPQYIVRGHGGHLVCDFHDSGFGIYTVKWFKDGREFFRYQPRSKNAIRTFAVDGVVVDQLRSTHRDLYLSSVGLTAAGSYMCEITSAPPTFRTVFEVTNIKVVDLPESRPVVSRLKHRYQIGDTLLINCTSFRSYPAAHLYWYINGKPIQQSHYSRVSESEISEPFNLSTTVSSLEVTLRPWDVGSMVQRSRRGEVELNIRCVVNLPGTNFRSHTEVRSRITLSSAHRLHTALSSASSGLFVPACLSKAATAILLSMLPSKLPAIPAMLPVLPAESVIIFAIMLKILDLVFLL